MASSFDATRVSVVDHPLVQHKLSLLRDKQTGCKQFRELVRELARLETYEATRDLPLEPVRIETPIAPMEAAHLAGRTPAAIPILRAGLGMLEGVLDLIPDALVGHLGMERDEVTHEPREYYAKLPRDIAERTCLVVDPMLATGGSAEAALSYLRAQGARDIRFLSIVAAPEGLSRVLEGDADVQVFACAIDECLNENAYIVPGLGDAGDRIFGTL